jgi:hypothetical protein
MSSGRRIDVDIVIYQELLKHLPRRDKKITIAALTPELERIFGGCLPCIIGRCLDVGHDGHLQFTFDTFNKIGKIIRGADTGKFCAGRNSHIGLERNMILERSQLTIMSAVCQTHQQHCCGNLYLAFRPKYCDYV